MENGFGIFILNIGKMYYKNKDEYHGQWRRGMRFGEGILKTKVGTYKFYNGDIYVGDWYKNCRFGIGRKYL